jgi:uncharacterized protein (TIGR03086 family)
MSGYHEQDAIMDALRKARPVDFAIPMFDDDPRAVFARAVTLGGTVIAAVHRDQLDGPTAGPERDVRELLGRLVGVLRRVAVIGRGEDPLGVPAVVSGLDDGAWLDAWLTAAWEVVAVWSDDTVLTRRLPWAELSGAATLAAYTSEVTLHTWDLAAATVRWQAAA